MMVTLTLKPAHAVWIRFMMLITKVNVNIKEVRSRSTIRQSRRADIALYIPFLLHQSLSCIPSN
ncbi:hypothetical protein E3U32_05125 [Lelliottia nimipressuralis]|nr:hypothetical protein E3U32_05125 [Lelliottia nimipressuralis]